MAQSKPESNKGPTKTEMAAAIGISRPYLSEIINNVHPVGIKAAHLLEAFTGEPWHTFMNRAKNGSQIEKEIVAALKKRAA